jgi:hypothetical protein
VTSSSSPVALVREGSYIFSVEAVNGTENKNNNNSSSSSSSLPFGFFRGILIRIQQPPEKETSSSMFSWTALERNSQSALACVGSDVKGITHTDNLPKTFISGLFQTFHEANVTVDITIVVANTDTESIYGYKQYSLQVFPPEMEDDNDINSNNTTAPTRTPAPTVTMQPTYAEYCNVCGIEDVESTTNTTSSPIVDPENIITLAGKMISCGYLQHIAERKLLPVSLCEKAQSLIRSECGGCNTTTTIIDDAAATPAEANNIFNRTVAPTPELPTYCMVCPLGMDLVHPKNVVRTSGSTCLEFVDASTLIDRSSATCELYRRTIEIDCGGCTIVTTPTAVPTPTLRRSDTTPNPTSSSAVASNDNDRNSIAGDPSDNTFAPPNEDGSSSITTSTGYYRLAVYDGKTLAAWRTLFTMECFLIAVMILVEL